MVWRINCLTSARCPLKAGEASIHDHDEGHRGLRAAQDATRRDMVVLLHQQRHLASLKAAPEEAGDIRTWIALDVRSKLLVFWLVGARDVLGANVFATGSLDI